MPVDERPTPSAGGEPKPLLATYRLQLRRELGFNEVRRWLSYFRALGVSHLYLSPILQAAPGSTHGYDVVDPTTVNAELGGNDAFRALSEEVHRAGLGQIVDIVPNHMAVGPQNPWWWDVLENGPSSYFAATFDLVWESTEERLRDKVLLPVLGDHAGLIIDNKEITLQRDGGRFTLAYHDHRFPVAPRSLGEVVGRAADVCGSPDLAFIADAYRNLPLPNATDRASVERRHRDKGVLGGQLARLAAERPEVAAALDQAVEALNADPEAMDAFLGQQNHRLAYWRSASRDLGYRRFFDVNNLAALRMEDENVFRASHVRVAEWLKRGWVDGVRVDHVDGLRDPLTYLARLRGLVTGGFIFVEKILGERESLRGYWPVDGTTGYEFASDVTALFVEPSGEKPLTALYERVTGETRSFDETELECKRQVAGDLFGSDLNRLTSALLAICEKRRHFRDYTRHEIHETLRELLAAFPVYRSYVREGEPAMSEDVRLIDDAVARVKERAPALDGRLVDFVGQILKGELGGAAEADFAARFQQTTGPVMAKGVEDTTFYVWNRFAALNDVGGSPSRFGLGLAELHAANEARAARWPRNLLASTTHDTKRSEDVRARMVLLAECPSAWADLVADLFRFSQRHRSAAGPDDATLYLLFQTLVGAWPLDSERAAAYMLKASREAKRQTSWTHPDAAFEEAVQGFVKGALADTELVARVEAFVATLLRPGRENGLAQLLLKLTSPGVPDIYQGSELWDLRLVDPDNREPVSFGARDELLRALDAESVGSLNAKLGDPRDPGLPKLWVLREALKVRRSQAPAFGEGGSYEPWAATGAKGDEVIAYARGGRVATVVSRWPLRRASSGGWQDTALALPAGAWRDVFSGARREGPSRWPLAELLGAFPVALLVKESG